MNQDTLTIVESILKEYPQTRDNDSRLAFIFYTKTIPMFYIPHDKDNNNYHAMDVVEFFRRLSNKKVTAMSSITRARRKLQEKFESLRGKNWKARQKHQKVVVNTMNKWEGERRNQINKTYHENKLSGGQNESTR